MGKKKKRKSQLPFRLNILFLFVFALFALLILQLGVVQILNGEAAQEEINRTESTTSKNNVPRGKMYDRFGRVILDNEPVRAITYTPPKGGASADERLDLAEKLSQFITLGEDEQDRQDLIRERDKKEYWYLLHLKDAEDRLTEEEKDLDPGPKYQATLDKITQEDLDEIEWSDSLLNILLIKKELDQAYQLSPHIVKGNDVTVEEYAKVSEHLAELPGIDATTDWDRKFIYGPVTFSDYIGDITESDKGIPSEKEDYYLSHGYSRNDRVGISGLEEKYESSLRGRKEQVQYITDKNGNVVGSEIVVEGQRGNDLVLTIDMELQQAVDDIVLDEFQQMISKNPQAHRYMSDALVAMMNPKTGDVLALSGIHYDQEEKEFSNQAYRVTQDAHRPGSTVKGATVLAGLDSGVFGPYESINDKCVVIAASEPMCSWDNLGPVDAVDALRRSSNVYMFHVAMRLGEATYRPGQKLIGYDPSKFQVMRNYFNQFGLGVETGIDLPFEGTGYMGQYLGAHQLMFYGIGQYDTFTTMQLAQYVSTIANDGYRVRPRLVQEIRKPVENSDQLGPVIQSLEPEVLNRIEMDMSHLKIVQEGFRQVMQSTGGTAVNYFADAPYKPAGKTGTAENEIYENGELIAETENMTLVGYAPFEDPEIAFAVVVPNTGHVSLKHPINHNIGRRILDKYFELKQERAENGINYELNNSTTNEDDEDDESEDNEE